MTGTKADIKNRLRKAGVTTITVDKRSLSLDKASKAELIKKASQLNLI